MKKFRVRLVALLLAAIFVFQPSVVFAKEAKEREYAAAQEVGSFIAQLLMLISDRYVGGSYDINALGEAAIRGIMSQLDLYSEYFNAAEYEYFMNSLNMSVTGIGIELEARDDGNVYIKNVIAGSNANGAGLQPGDMLYKAGDKFLTGMSVEQLQAVLRSFGENQFVLTVIRDQKSIEVNVQRAKLSQGTVFATPPQVMKEWLGKGRDAAYIQVTTIGENTAAEFKNALTSAVAAGKTTLILDMRDNLGGYVDVAADICKMILPKGDIITTVDKDGKTETLRSGLEKPPFEKIYILVNKYTASAAEIITSALQDSGIAVVIGETTYGKGVIQSLYTVSDGSCIKLTTGEYLRRSGARLNLIGITPDIVVKELADRDVPLMTALQELSK